MRTPTSLGYILLSATTLCSALVGGCTAAGDSNATSAGESGSLSTPGTDPAPAADPARGLYLGTRAFALGEHVEMFSGLPRQPDLLALVVDLRTLDLAGAICTLSAKSVDDVMGTTMERAAEMGAAVSTVDHPLAEVGARCASELCHDSEFDFGDAPVTLSAYEQVAKLEPSEVFYRLVIGPRLGFGGTILLSTHCERPTQ